MYVMCVCWDGWNVFELMRKYHVEQGNFLSLFLYVCLPFSFYTCVILVKSRKPGNYSKKLTKVKNMFKKLCLQTSMGFI